MRQRNGILALLVIGGYVAWRNRSRIQQIAQSLADGATNALTKALNVKGDHLKNQFSSNVSRITGSLRDSIRSSKPDQHTRQAI